MNEAKLNAIHEKILKAIAGMDRLASAHVAETGKTIQLLGEREYEQYSEEIKRCAHEWERAASALGFWTNRLLMAETIIVPTRKETGGGNFVGNE